MLVLGMQLTGGSGSEANDMLSAMNLPNGATMGRKIFHHIKELLGTIIRDVRDTEIKRR